MRYEPIDLNVLAAFFEKMDRKDLEAWIKSEPVGKYARRAWYLYEFLTGETLDVPEVPPTENVLLLDPRITHHSNRRLVSVGNVSSTISWAIAITAQMIRRTDRLNAVMQQQQLGEEAKNIVEGADPTPCWPARSTTSLRKRPNLPLQSKVKCRALTGRCDLWQHLGRADRLRHQR
jgi:hypothetical protein